MATTSEDTAVAAAAAAAVVDAEVAATTTVTTDTQYDTTMIKNVTERLEFFFSDANARQDIFVRKHLLSTKDDTKGCDIPGYVTIDTLLTFNTIKQYTTDKNVIVHVVQTILNNKLKLNIEQTAVTTVIPFTKSKMDDNIPLSMYVSNLPYDTETNRYSVSIQDISNLFIQYGKVALVHFRFKRYKNNDDTDEIDANIQPSLKQEEIDDSSNKNNDNNNKKSGGGRKRFPIGAALVEFESIDSLEKSASDVLTSKNGIECVPTRPLQLKDNKLVVVLLSDFIASKKKRKLDELQNGSEPKGQDEKDEKQQQQKHSNNNNNENISAKTFTIDWKSGCVIKLKGLSIDCDRESLLSSVAIGLNKTIDEIKDLKIYVDYSRGQEDGAIRFDIPTDDISTLCTKLNNGTVTIANANVSSAYILQDTEEQQYWDNFIEFKNIQLRQQKDRNHNSSNYNNNNNRNNNNNHRNNNKNYNKHQNNKRSRK